MILPKPHNISKDAKLLSLETNLKILLSLCERGCQCAGECEEESTQKLLHQITDLLKEAAEIQKNKRELKHANKTSQDIINPITNE